MPSTARTARRATRQLVTAAVATFALSVGSGALVSAHAQSAYSYSGSGPSVTVDYSVLNRLGPAPQVPDSRVIRHAPAQPATHHVALGHSAPRHSRVVAQAHPTQRVAEVVQDGSVTIDYRALVALNP